MSLNFSSLVGIAIALLVALMVTGAITGYRPSFMSQAGMVSGGESGSGW